ncbi:amylo-alpha-1,6-glucosidase [Thermocoleostomius sinensis]|jgi:glycogen debranching enzyme|uniref:Amylo-alpha-1,6-glucosidase n=1 Tax=Thermocoleostomius sinensis A174 TaxID=2016057 RepID=A0A9E8ZID6_9CYAN|nr:amylo-alpha-1,6-glucosidase [Thermocoleostomius sinensis]WAL62354.1 amylo-alpha-1,6-glucosidase [Thermocoleostomius sinensis A174]
MAEIVVDGRVYVPADELPIPGWACIETSKYSPTLTLKDDDLFLITDTLGNIGGCSDEEAISSLGLFCRDTRFLSRLELQIEGRLPILLSSNAQHGFALSVLCSNPRIDDRIPAETLSIQREILLNGGLFEELTITNYGTQPAQFELSLSFDADFLDLFEIRGFDRKQRGRLLRRVDPMAHQGAHRERSEMSQSEGGEPNENGNVQIDTDQIVFTPYSALTELSLAYQGLDDGIMESRIEFRHRPPDFIKGYTAIWRIEIASHETERLGYRLEMLTNNRPVSRVNIPMTLMQAKAAEMMEEQEWRANITQIRSDNRTFNQVIERAEQDIYLLRQTFTQGKILSAGVPWFCTLFGRDSIIAASQTLILDPAIARETLTVLAHYQGKVDDEWREEEPGKILHELRLGEMARCHEIPHTPYYGTVDATPLWIMLYAEYYAWTHDRETLEKLWEPALAAMEWIDRSCKETGYLSYDRRSRRGLKNQGWKDSGDCIVDRNGQQAVGPISLAEVQAYVYAAKIRLSEIARLKKRIDLADRWLEEAHDLKVRFNRDFWITDLDYCALALDGEGNQVDSITSNPGHCLNYGIFPAERAKSIAERLQAPDMFNGWGIRTLSSLSPAYNPMGYHVGSVWPHDNGIITLGLRSLGLVDQALEVAQGLIDMTIQQPYQRPPELFCGYERNGESGPVRYPVACSPQAWATGTIFQLLQMMVNLVPDAPGNHVRIIDPALPPSIPHLSLKNLKVGSTLLDLEFVREGTSLKERSGATTACRVVKKRGNLRVVIEA